jgi:hypothetical protein
MEKRVVLSTICIFFVISPLFAPNEFIHNLDLIKVILGRQFTQNRDEEVRIELLEKASFLTIDEFNGNNLQYLDELKAAGVKNLPLAADIDFTAGGTHQRYTHRGWEWTTYPENLRGYNFQEIWNKRKSILISTLDNIFEFRQNEIIKRDSLGAIIYYTHVLGDHWGDSKGSYLDRMPISPRPDYRFNSSGPNSNNPTIYTELLYHIPRLFRDQSNSVDLRMLILYLERRKSTQFSTGTTITEEEYSRLQIFARETLDTLCIYIPRLLQNELFYKRAFLMVGR